MRYTYIILGRKRPLTHKTRKGDSNEQKAFIPLGFNTPPLCGGDYLFVAGTVALVLAGCGTLFNAIGGETEVETETSQSFKNAAVDLVLTKEEGILPDTFTMAFERKFPGLKFNSEFRNHGFYSTDILFSHEGKNYRMADTSTAKGDGSIDTITKIDSCVERQKKETQ
jgi:hypothetical protein